MDKENIPHTVEHSFENTEAFAPLGDTEAIQNTPNDSDTLEAETDIEEDIQKIPSEEITQEESIALLKKQAEELRREIKALEEIKNNNEKLLSELKEFTEIFPESSIDDLPEEVWESVKKGSSLAAAFALYEKKTAAQRLAANEINTRNARLSPGIAGIGADSEYFTPAQVKKMSRAEVRKNYEKIRESMKKWN